MIETFVYVRLHTKTDSLLWPFQVFTAEKEQALTVARCHLRLLVADTKRE